MKGREEGEVDEGGEERRTRGQIVQDVVAGIKEKVSVHSGDKDDVRRPVEQSFMRSWIAHKLKMKKRRKADEKGTKWQPSGRRSKNCMRWIEGDSLKLEYMRKAPELVVHERMSQGDRERGLKEKKRVPGWSAEEMKEKPNNDILRKWRCFNQSEMDQCWRNLAEGTEEEVLNMYKVEERKKSFSEVEVLFWNGGVVRKSKKYRIRKWREDCWARIFRTVQRIQLAASANQAG